MVVMPWCTSCDRFLSPSTVSVDGACPECGRAVDPGRAHTAGQSTDLAGAVPVNSPVDGPLAPSVEDDDERPPLPWHLWLLLAALAVYLGYRAFQGIELLFGM